MGCMVASPINSAKDRQMQMFDQQQQMVAQTQAQRSTSAFRLATGETFLPMNHYTGEFPKAYPNWLFDTSKVPNETWVYFVSSLNNS